MSLITGNRLGLEDIAREAGIILINNINAALATEDALWAAKDAALATLRGVDYVACTSDDVLAKNIHVGHKPSFILAPIDKFPNICVMSYYCSDSEYQNIDQGDDQAIRMFVEVQVLQGPYESGQAHLDEAEELVNKKIQRMVEAIYNVLMNNKTLNGLIADFQGTPEVVVTECYKRDNHPDDPVEGAYDYYWQMARLEFNIIKSSSNLW